MVLAVAKSRLYCMWVGEATTRHLCALKCMYCTVPMFHSDIQRMCPLLLHNCRGSLRDGAMLQI